MIVRNGKRKSILPIFHNFFIKGWYVFYLPYTRFETFVLASHQVGIIVHS